ncbi:MAG: hypothetical protein ACT4UP_02810 [Gammaproteobacteria bacterium]
MPGRQDSSIFRIVEQDGPGRRLVLESLVAGGRRRIVVSGYQGPALPATLRDPVFDAAEGAGWRLTAAEGVFEFRARSVDRIDEQPQLYEPLHRPFALTAGDRAAVGILLWLLRLPGGARLLRRWHAERSR